MSTISTTTNNNTTRKTIPPTTKTTTPTTTTEKTTIVKQTPAKKIAPVLSTGNNLKMTSKTVESIFSINTIYMMVAAAGGGVFITSMICLVIHCCTWKKKPSPKSVTKPMQDRFDTVRSLIPRKTRRMHNIGSYEHNKYQAALKRI